MRAAPGRAGQPHTMNTFTDRFKTLLAILRDGLNRPWLVLAALLALAAALGGTACTSPGAGTPYAAAVTITNHPLAQIEAVTIDVFTRQGYTGIQTGAGEFLFEKPGDTSDKITYGNLMGGGVWIRIKVTTHSVDAARTILGCDASSVVNHGDSILEEATPISSMRHGKYKELLLQVSARLR